MLLAVCPCSWSVGFAFQTHFFLCFYCRHHWAIGLPTLLNATGIQGCRPRGVRSADSAPEHVRLAAFMSPCFEPLGTPQGGRGYVATRPTCGPLLILFPALKRWGPPRRQGLCSNLAHLWATSDFVPRQQQQQPRSPQKRTANHSGSRCHATNQKFCATISRQYLTVRIQFRVGVCCLNIFQSL